MKFNTDPSFAGLETLKRTHNDQIAQFEDWAARNDWETFHRSHYDWWAFPIDQPSAYGFKWVVYEGEIASLKTEAEFMSSYRRGLVLLAASWGWDLDSADFLTHPLPSQCWHNWPIRLYKAAYSGRLFGEHRVFNSYKKYATHLREQGESFEYNGRDLFELFSR